MGIRHRLGEGEATIQDMERAMESRYYEALHLIVSPDEAHRWGGVYLLGYVGEMVLKVAYFKLKDCLPGDEAWTALRDHAPEEAVISGIIETKRSFNFHNLQHLLELVLATRQDKGRVRFPSISGTDLSNAVSKLQENWWVGMRYFGGRPTIDDVKEAFEAASWLRTFYYELWS